MIIVPQKEDKSNIKLLKSLHSSNPIFAEDNKTNIFIEHVRPQAEYDVDASDDLNNNAQFHQPETEGTLDTVRTGSTPKSLTNNVKGNHKNSNSGYQFFSAENFIAKEIKQFEELLEVYNSCYAKIKRCTTKNGKYFNHAAIYTIVKTIISHTKTQGLQRQFKSKNSLCSPCLCVKIKFDFSYVSAPKKYKNLAFLVPKWFRNIPRLKPVARLPPNHSSS